MFSFRNSTQELTDSGVETVIISVGATEQLGPNLPLHIDTLVADYFAEAWGKQLNAYVLPTLPFNTSEEHSAFKGTITLRPATIMRVMEDVVTVLREQGFRKQVLSSGHGGSLWRGAFIKDMNWKFKDIVLVDAHQGGVQVFEEGLKRVGLAGRAELHGGAHSRALAFYLAPDCVRSGPYGTEVPEAMMSFADYVTWDKITADGSWGTYTPADDEVATAEAGRQLLEYFVEQQGRWLKQHLKEACQLKGIPQSRS